MKPFSFSAEIFIIGVNPYVYLPENILQEVLKLSKKSSGPIPVKGKINGKDFIQTLVKYKGAYRLYINGVMRNAAQVAVGDTVHIEFSYDSSSREIPMHLEFKKALDNSAHAREVFGNYAPSRQKEINRYINNVKTDETRKNVIEKVLNVLTGNKHAKYFVLMRNKK